MGEAPDKPFELSVVVPVYNEAGNIVPLADEVAQALSDVCRYELIFVDDGSSDATADELELLQAADKTVRVLRHRKRSGKSAALVTGFWAARAPWIQTLDGDRQNDPQDVARIHAWESFPDDANGATTARSNGSRRASPTASDEPCSTTVRATPAAASSC